MPDEKVPGLSFREAREHAMPRWHVHLRLTLGELMGLVATTALAFGIMPAVPATVFSSVALVFTCAVAVLAPVTRLSRPALTALLYSLYPALPILSLHAWAATWRSLPCLYPGDGMLDEFISYLFVGCIPALVVCVIVTFTGLIRNAIRLDSPRWSTLPHPARSEVLEFYLLILSPVLFWGLSFLVLMFDPFGALDWWFST